MRVLFRQIFKCERGATVIEYGLICALIVLAIMGGIVGTGNSAYSLWTNVANKVVNR